MIYAAYLRDSGGEEQELSIQQQEKEIRTWCQAKGFSLTTIFKDEARPGSSAISREAFQAMMHHFRSGAAQEQGIIIWKFSRFARDIDDAQFYKADLRRRGYQILSIKDQVPDGLDGRFFEAAIDWMNQRFLDDLSTDVKRGLRHLVSEYGGVPGTPPRGFKREPIHIGAHRDGKPHIVHKWVPDPETWDRCKLAWQMRADGASYTEIRKATGNLYTANSGFKHFFSNPIYKGTLIYGDQHIENYAPPMVAEETWALVQRINDARSIRNTPAGIENPHHPRRARSSYILSGLVRCAQCGSLMNGATHVHNKKNHTNYYYECNQAKRKRGCTARKIPRHTLENAVLGLLLEYLSQPEQLRQLIERSQQQRQPSQLHHKKEEITKELGTVKARITRILDTIAEIGHNQSVLEKLTTLENHKNELQAQLNHYQRIAPSPADIDYAAYAAQITKALRVADRNAQRILLRGLIDHITAERQENTVTGMIHFVLPSVCVYGVEPPKGIELYTQTAAFSLPFAISITPQ
jgi:DNA invertase Pin-like site-specific DNA recombinase